MLQFFQTGKQKMFKTKASCNYVSDFSQRFEKLFPPKNLTFKTPSLLASKNDNTTTSLSVLPGAPYRYEVVTKSLGDDETTSDVTFVDKTLGKFEFLNV